MHRRHATGYPSVAASALAIAVALGASAGLVACGSDGSAEPASTTPASGATIDNGSEAATDTEYAVVSDADVSAGLASTITTLTSLSAAPVTATEEAVTGVLEDWGSYEGTVKQNDVNTYLALEDALGAFKKGAEAADQAAMTAALADFTTASSTYLTAHPG